MFHRSVGDVAPQVAGLGLGGCGGSWRGWRVGEAGKLWNWRTSGAARKWAFP